MTDAEIWSTGEGLGDSLAVREYCFHSEKKRSLGHSPYLMTIEQNGAGSL